MNQSVTAVQSAPTVDLGSVPSGASPQSSPALQQAANLFLEQGFVVLKNVFDVGTIQRLHDEFTAGYNHYFRDQHFADALPVGPGRTMVTVRVEGGFNSPEIYANQRIFGLLKYLLDDNMILGSMGAVSSLPGAAIQHLHRDHANIFNNAGSYPGGDRCRAVMPPYAVTLVVPLIPLTEATGSTRLWPGSHLVPDNHEMKVASVDPLVPLGDCYLMDYRVMHCGLPNRSEQVRPILYNIYSRPWFRDYQNYPRQVPLSINETELAKVPTMYRELFNWSFAQSNVGGRAVETLMKQRLYPEPELSVSLQFPR